MQVGKENSGMLLKKENLERTSALQLWSFAVKLGVRVREPSQLHLEMLQKETLKAILLDSVLN